MEGNNIKKIYFGLNFNLAESFPYHNYKFIFDFENNRAYFRKKEIYDLSIYDVLNEENENIFKNIHSFYTDEVFNLDNIEMNELNSVIVDLKREYEKNPLLYSGLTSIVYYTMAVEYSNEERDHFSFYYNEIPLKLFEIFEKGLGFDVFNSDNIKLLVTEKDYVINKNNIYDKETGEELILKKMDYSKECGKYLQKTTNSFHLDFDEKELITHDNEKIKLSNADVKNIVSLIKKYGVFKWNSIEYSKKALSKDEVFDGCHWRLSLVFNGGRVLNFGGWLIQQDTYVDFGAELFNIFGVDLLTLREL